MFQSMWAGASAENIARYRTYPRLFDPRQGRRRDFVFKHPAPDLGALAVALDARRVQYQGPVLLRRACARTSRDRSKRLRRPRMLSTSPPSRAWRSPTSAFT
jgi:hypothetical protein